MHGFCRLDFIRFKENATCADGSLAEGVGEMGGNFHSEACGISANNGAGIPGIDIRISRALD